MDAKETYEGVIAVRGKGTGFVALPKYEEDIVIEPDDLSFALDGDVVEIELKPAVSGRRREGKVVRVIRSRRSEFVGLVEKDEHGYRLIPDLRHIHIRPRLPNATKTDENMKVVARITSWERPDMDPTAKIEEVLGPAGAHETEMQAIIRSGGFAQDFPHDVQTAAEKLYQTKEEIFRDAIEDSKRRDMRDVTTMTIDPKDAKDFDDAISFRTFENGNVEVGIHIADVSHYVRENDPIDIEAAERGTSIYLVDRVIPMLPEVLSNDLCSLRPNVDRLAFSAVFELTADGAMVDEWYGQTVIHSNKRFTYEEAQDVLDAGSGELHAELAVLMSIARQLRKQRFKNGAISFERPEVRFELDEAGAPVRVYTKERTETMLMIEDYMLLANQRVATHVNELAKKRGRDGTFVYRVHDAPDPEKIQELSIFLHALGYELASDHGTVKATDINKLLKEIKGVPEENLIKTATIRSMAKAVYSTKNIGHFGLAFKFYTHFTSPIRRYPDLMVHRLLRLHLDNMPVSGRERARAEKLSIQSSEREMEASSAERSSIKFKQVEFMQGKVGETFEGVISGVSDWGIYVEEKESKAEGMVRLSNIPGDYFEHEASKYRVKGQRTGKTYSLGDEVNVLLTRADVEKRELDFKLV